jgi:hypothetical protein
MEGVSIVYAILFLVLLIVLVSGIMFRKAVQKEKRKQALFEDRFSKNYDKYPYRRSKLR